MNFEAITIRPADTSDIDEIWHLLHADSKTWSEERITRNIQQLLVLTKQNKLLGVLFGELTSGKEEVIWIVIHPLYPEAQLKELMIQGLKGTQCHVRIKKHAKQIATVFPCPSE